MHLRKKRQGWYNDFVCCLICHIISLYMRASSNKGTPNHPSHGGPWLSTEKQWWLGVPSFLILEISIYIYIYTYIHIAYIIYIYILINLIGSIHISRIGHGWQPEGYNTWRNYWIQVQSIYLWHSAVLIQNHWSWSPNWFQVFVFARKVLYFRNLTGRYQASLLEFPGNKANWIAMWIHVTFQKKREAPQKCPWVDHGWSWSITTRGPEQGCAATGTWSPEPRCTLASWWLKFSHG